MDALIPLLKNVIIFVALAIPGYIFVKSGSLRQEHSGVLSKILMYIGLPFMILSGTLGVELNGDTVRSIVIVALIGIAITFLVIFIATLITKKTSPTNQAYTEKMRGMMCFCEAFANNGFLGLPIGAAVFGTASPVFTCLVVLNIINNTLIYTVGVYLISCDKRTIKLNNVVLNPVLIAFFVGIILNLLNFKTVLPEVLTYSDHFKNVVTPLSMTILGMKLGAIKIADIFKSKENYFVSVIKLIFVPVIATAISIGINLIYPIGREMIIAIFIAFAMPTAGLASAFADRYDGDTKGAVIYTLGSTIFSIITIPLLYALLCIVI